MACHQATGLWRVGVSVCFGDLYILFWLLWVCVRKVRWEHCNKAAAFHLILSSSGYSPWAENIFHLQRAQPLNANIAPLNRNLRIILLWNEAGNRSKFWSTTLRKYISVHFIWPCTVQFDAVWLILSHVALSHSEILHKALKCCCFF